MSTATVRADKIAALARRAWANADAWFDGMINREQYEHTTRVIDADLDALGATWDDLNEATR